jgi:lysine-N-methylase
MKSLPVHSLPVWQHWDCHGCGNCCRDYQVAVTDAERERIAAQGWEKEPALAGEPLFVAKGPWWKKRWRLNHRPDGACIFLNEAGRCRIHEKFGGDTKPLACRVYPFVLVAAGDEWRVGLRFACPSVAGDKGRPLAEHRVEGYAAELSRQTELDASEVAPPRLQLTQRVEWKDLLRFVDALANILRDRQLRMETRLRHCLALAKLCKHARFDKVQGARLSEFLRLVSSGLAGDVPADGAALPAPTWVGRVLFRQLLALYTRKDQGTDVGPMTRKRLALLAAAWRFALGRGAVPRGHAWIPETTFEAAEQPAGPLPEAAERALERYYTLKVESLQFCGATNFGMSFWEGFASLALTMPAILWVARSMRDMPREEAIIRAITMVDHNFGFNPLLGSLRQRYSLGILVQRGELERLIGWYSR